MNFADVSRVAICPATPLALTTVSVIFIGPRENPHTYTPSLTDKELLKYDLSLKKLCLSNSIPKVLAKFFVPLEETKGAASTTKLARNVFSLFAFNGAVESLTFGVDAAEARASTTYSANTWTHAASQYISTSSRTALQNAANKGTNSDTETPQDIAIFGIGATVDTTQVFWQGDLQEVQIHNIALSDDWLTEEYAQTNDNGSFWGAWSWTSPGGTTHQLAGSIDSHSDLAGTLNLIQRMSGSLNSSSNTSGVLRLIHGLSGSLNSSSVVSGTIRLIHGLSASIQSISTLVGNLRLIQRISGLLNSTTHLSGNLSVPTTHSMSGSLNTSSLLSGNLTIVGAVELNHPLSATIKDLTPRGILTIDELHATIKNLDPRGGIV